MDDKDEGEHGKSTSIGEPTTNADDASEAEATRETNGTVNGNHNNSDDDEDGEDDEDDGSKQDETAQDEEQEEEEEEANNDDNGDNENSNDEDDDEDDDGGDDEDSMVTSRTAESKGANNGSSARGKSTSRAESEENDSDDDSFPDHIPDYLDRRTLKGIKSYLENFDHKQVELDEDEVVNFMTKADRNVENRVRYYSNPLDDLIDEENMVQDFHREEFDHMVGHDFMKEMTTTLQDRKRRKGVDKRTLNWVKRAAGLNRKDYHTPHSAIGGDENDSDHPDGKGRAPKRYTRSIARSTRIKKKEEFLFKDNIGIKSLLDAIEGMEDEAGPYPVPFECRMSRERAKTRQMDRKRPSIMSRVNSRASVEASDNEDDEEKPIFIRKDNSHLLLMRPLVARLTEEDVNDGLMRRGDDYVFGDHRDLLITKLYVNGAHVKEDEEDAMTMTERKRELKRMRDRQYQKRKRDLKARQKRQLSESNKARRGQYTTPIRSNTKRLRDYESESEDEHQPRRSNGRPSRSSKRSKRSGSLARTLKGPTSLALLDWKRRQMWTAGNDEKKLKERDVRASVSIPEYMTKCGISYRLPPWETVNPASNILTKSHQSDALKEKHSDDVYARWTHKLIKCLDGSARAWAMHEFFYSDIDRSWYNSNTFARDAAKLGILPNAKLARREWGAVRQMIRRRPRRFSKRFIFSQLQERNKFRDLVRHLQQHPDETNHTGYEIPAPIRVGATVSAYNKKFLILHRGVVLFHDVASARYLVQFERKSLGFELCSDTEVASHGVPNTNMPAAPGKLTGAPHEGAIGGLTGVGALPYGTSFGPLTVLKTKDDLTCEKEVASILTKTGPTNDSIPVDEDAAREAVVEKVAERETLVTLMATVDAATSRKELLLDVMEKFNVLLVDRLPFGEGPSSNHVISEYFEKHFSWLRANLETTNQTLNCAQFYLERMYSKAYSSTSTATRLRNEKIKEMFLDTVLRQDGPTYGAPPTATVPWMHALGDGSKEVGKFLATLACHDNANPGQKGPSSASEKSRVGAAAAVLSAIEYCSGRSAESEIVLPDEEAPLLETVLAANLGNLESPEFSDPTGAFQEIVSDRADAAKELKEAISMLNKEFNIQALVTRPLLRPVGI